MDIYQSQYTAAQIDAGIILANSAYQKPQSGIPASDLANDVIPGDFGASGTNHAHGLVPDPGATQGNTKFLREDGSWAVPAGSGAQQQADWNQSDNTAVDYIKNKPTIPVIPSNTAYLSNDSGEGIVPDDGIRAVTVTSGATMTISPDVVTVIDGAVGTAAITLQVPQDNLAHVWDFIFETDSTTAVTIAMSNSATILKPSGYALVASSNYEIRVIGKGTKFVLAYGEFA